MKERKIIVPEREEFHKSLVIYAVISLLIGLLIVLLTAFTVGYDTNIVPVYLIILVTIFFSAVDYIALLLPEIIARYVICKKQFNKRNSVIFVVIHYFILQTLFYFRYGDYTYGLIIGWLWIIIQWGILRKENARNINDSNACDIRGYMNDDQSPIAVTSSADKARLAELNEELKKIPVAKVKKWHEEGKLTDEQYKAIAKKYNSMLKESDEIQERMELLKNIDE